MTRICSSSYWSGMSCCSIVEALRLEPLRLGPLDLEAVELVEQLALASARRRRSGPASSASAAVTLTASVTIRSARSPLRPWPSASART